MKESLQVHWQSFWVSKGFTSTTTSAQKNISPQKKDIQTTLHVIQKGKKLHMQTYVVRHISLGSVLGHN
jgi:predicted alpha/beta hydrolase family esterase